MASTNTPPRESSPGSSISPASSDPRNVAEGSSRSPSQTSPQRRRLRRAVGQNSQSPTCSSFTFTDTMEVSAFREEEGRLYNATQDDYALPADPEEAERLDVQHVAVKKLIGKNYVGPVEEFLNSGGVGGVGKRILDIGCGTGKWVIEMAEEFPQAEFVGMDLVPIQPDDVPENASFVIDDFVAGLPFPPESFDMVHVRQLCFGIRDHTALFKSCATVLKSGGLLLTVEAEVAYFTSGQDAQVVAPSSTYLYGDAARRGLEARGLDPFAALRIPEILLATGLYRGVDTTRADIPLSPWSDDPFLRDVGQLMRESARMYPEVIKLILMDGAGLSAEDYEALRLGHIAELDDLKANLMMSMWMTWATKK